MCSNMVIGRQVDGDQPSLSERIAGFSRRIGINVQRRISRVGRTVTVDIGGERYDFSVGFPERMGSPAAFDSEALTIKGDVRNTIETEIHVLERLRTAVRPADVFWDVGAGYGEHAVVAGKELTDGSVVLLEPRAEVSLHAKSNVEINDIPGEVINIGLGEGFDLIRSTEVSQPVVSGDELVAVGVPRPTVIKVDIEGMELEAIRGLRETLSTDDCRLVAIEVHTEKAVDDPQHRTLDESSVAELEDELRRSGFELEWDRSGPYPFIWAEKREVE